MELHVSIKSCRGISGIGDKSECFLYASVDWQGKTYYTEVLANTLRPSWRKGNFTVPFSGSSRHQALAVSVYNCDRTGNGNDTFLGQALIDLYNCFRYDESSHRNSQVYDEWVSIEDGLSQGGSIRVKLVAAEPTGRNNWATNNAAEEGEDGSMTDNDIDDEHASDEAINQASDDITLNVNEHRNLCGENYLAGAEEEERKEAVSRKTSSLIGTEEVVVAAKPRISNFFLASSVNRCSTTRRSVKGVFMLKLKVVEARDLMPREPDVAVLSGVFPNSFCCIVWRGEMFLTSSVLRTLNPKWKKAKFSLPADFSDLEEIFTVHVHDYDTQSQSDIGTLGEVKIDLTQFEPNIETDDWFPVFGGRGMLRIKILLQGDHMEMIQHIERFRKGLSRSLSDEYRLYPKDREREERTKVQEGVREALVVKPSPVGSVESPQAAQSKPSFVEDYTLNIDESCDVDDNSSHVEIENSQPPNSDAMAHFDDMSASRKPVHKLSKAQIVWERNSDIVDVKPVKEFGPGRETVPFLPPTPPSHRNKEPLSVEAENPHVTDAVNHELRTSTALPRFVINQGNRSEANLHGRHQNKGHVDRKTQYNQEQYNQEQYSEEQYSEEQYNEEQYNEEQYKKSHYDLVTSINLGNPMMPISFVPPKPTLLIKTKKIKTLPQSSDVVQIHKEGASEKFNENDGKDPGLVYESGDRRGQTFLMHIPKGTVTSRSNLNGLSVDPSNRPHGSKPLRPLKSGYTRLPGPRTY